MSSLGRRALPTSLYALIGFEGATPGFTLGAAIDTLNNLSPISSPYGTLLPAPATTPLLTVRAETGTPRLAAARSSNACFAVAAALRTRWPVLEMEVEPFVPPVTPVSGATLVS